MLQGNENQPVLVALQHAHLTADAYISAVLGRHVGDSATRLIGGWPPRAV
jgi:hypothetical protein